MYSNADQIDKLRKQKEVEEEPTCFDHLFPSLPQAKWVLLMKGCLRGMLDEVRKGWLGREIGRNSCSWLSPQQGRENMKKNLSPLSWRRFKCSVPWATSGLMDSTGTITGIETQLSALLGMGQLLGDSWGGLRGEGLRSGWRWTPHLGVHGWTSPLLGRPQCWRACYGVSFRENKLRWSAGLLSFPGDPDLSWVHPWSHWFPAGVLMIISADAPVTVPPPPWGWHPAPSEPLFPALWAGESKGLLLPSVQKKTAGSSHCSIKVVILKQQHVCQGTGCDYSAGNNTDKGKPRWKFLTSLIHDSG